MSSQNTKTGTTRITLPHSLHDLYEYSEHIQFNPCNMSVDMTYMSHATHVDLGSDAPI